MQIQNRVCRGRRKLQNQCGTLKREGGREAAEQIFVTAERHLCLVERQRLEPCTLGYEPQLSLAEPVTLGKFIFVSHVMVLICQRY